MTADHAAQGGDPDAVKAVIDEAFALLRIAASAHRRLRLAGEGGDVGHCHEVRMFAQAFSPAQGSGELAAGNGRLQAWREAARAAVSAAQENEGAAGGYVIGDATGELWMGWGQAGPEWIRDQEQALCFVRRIDAERLCAECEDAWHIVPLVSDWSIVKNADRYAFLRDHKNVNDVPYITSSQDWLFGAEADEAVDAARDRGAA